jgi:dodecin
MDKVYQILQLVGTSQNSIEEAIQNALTKAHESAHKVDWFEVLETRGYVENAVVKYYQVNLKIGCAN